MDCTCRETWKESQPVAMTEARYGARTWTQRGWHHFGSCPLSVPSADKYELVLAEERIQELEHEVAAAKGGC